MAVCSEGNTGEKNHKNCEIDIQLTKIVTAQTSPDEDLTGENWRNREEEKKMLQDL